MIYSEKTPYKYSKEHAIELQRRYPSFFKKSMDIKTWKEFLHALHISFDVRDNTQLSGRYEAKVSGDTIIVNHAMPVEEQIEIIAHEVGHWLLRNEHPDINNNYSIEWKELYAKHFAKEISIPIFLRNEIIQRLFNATTAFEIIKIKKEYKLNVPLTNIFTILYNEDRYIDKTCEHVCNLWIVAKWKAKKTNPLDTKLRITRTFFDIEKFYVPTNQGIERILTNIEPLNNLSTNEEYSFNTIANIKIRVDGEEKKEFKNKKVPCYCSALRLIESKYDSVPNIVLLLRLRMHN